MVGRVCHRAEPALDGAVVAAYLIWIVYDGLRLTKRSKEIDGYFRGNRSLPWWTVGLSVMATQLSAITMIGTTGQGYVNGMGGLMMIGDPDEVAQTLADLSRAGVRGIGFSFVNYLEELPFFCEEVLPRLERMGIREKRR